MPGAVDEYRATMVTITITAHAEPAEATAVTASFDPCDARGNGLPSNCIPSGKGFSLEVPEHDPSTELIEDAHFHFNYSPTSSAPIALDASETSLCDVLVGDNLGGGTPTPDYIV